MKRHHLRSWYTTCGDLIEEFNLHKKLEHFIEKEKFNVMLISQEDKNISLLILLTRITVRCARYRIFFKQQEFFSGKATTSRKNFSRLKYCEFQINCNRKINWIKSGFLRCFEKKAENLLLFLKKLDESWSKNQISDKRRK